MRCLRVGVDMPGLSRVGSFYKRGQGTHQIRSVANSRRKLQNVVRDSTAALGGLVGLSFLTLASSAHRNDLDVWAYVKDVIDQLLAIQNVVRDSTCEILTESDYSGPAQHAFFSEDEFLDRTGIRAWPQGAETRTATPALQRKAVRP